MAKRTTGRTLVSSLGLRFRPDQERLVRITWVGIMSAHGERRKITCTTLFAGLRLVVVRKQAGVSEVARSKFDKITAGLRLQRFVAL